MADRRASARARGYDSRWDKARKAFLAKHPLCAEHHRKSQVAIATVVDHIKPHRGDMKLFWDRTNWQPLCAECHSRHKQREDNRGYSAAVGEDGWPVDHRHPINR